MNYKHGHSAGGVVTRTYRIWEGMLHRCRHHPQYAGRGIEFDPRWARFENFFADMGEAPAGLTLDRIDNDGPYAMANCRWATYSQQNFNQRKRRPRTTRHGSAGLTDEQALAIIRDPRSGAKIGEDYDLSRSMVNRIKRGAAYKHLRNHQELGLL